MQNIMHDIDINDGEGTHLHTLDNYGINRSRTHADVMISSVNLNIMNENAMGIHICRMILPRGRQRCNEHQGYSTTLNMHTDYQIVMYMMVANDSKCAAQHVGGIEIDSVCVAFFIVADRTLRWPMFVSHRGR